MLLCEFFSSVNADGFINPFRLNVNRQDVRRIRGRIEGRYSEDQRKAIRGKLSVVTDCIYEQCQ